MPPDIAQIEPDGSENRWEFPEVVEIRINRVPFQPPKLRNFESPFAKDTEAVEFRVRTNGPVPQAISWAPVLYVGETSVSEGAPVEDNVYRFLAFERDQLVEGAQLALGWPRQIAEERRKTKFQYKTPAPLKQDEGA